MRRAAGMTLDDVAAAAGISKTIVSEWENGHHDPTLSRLTAYAEAVGADLAVTARRAGHQALTPGETT